jgi:hypothetical protein
VFFFKILNSNSFDSSAGCREDYLEISGSRICGSQVGSVLFPIDKNAKTTKISFKTNHEGTDSNLELLILPTKAMETGISVVL